MQRCFGASSYRPREPDELVVGDDRTRGWRNTISALRRASRDRRYASSAPGIKRLESAMSFPFESRTDLIESRHFR